CRRRAEVPFEDGRRDACGYPSALAILDHHRHHEPGVLDRSKSHEPGMAGTLRILRRTGLATYLDPGHLSTARGASRRHDVRHRHAKAGKLLRREVENPLTRGRRLTNDARGSRTAIRGESRVEPSHVGDGLRIL